MNIKGKFSCSTNPPLLHVIKPILKFGETPLKTPTLLWPLHLHMSCLRKWLFTLGSTKSNIFNVFWLHNIRADLCYRMFLLLLLLLFLLAFGGTLNTLPNVVELWFWWKGGSTIGYGWIFQINYPKWRMYTDQIYGMYIYIYIYTNRPQMQLIIGWKSIW